MPLTKSWLVAGAAGVLMLLTREAVCAQDTNSPAGGALSNRLDRLRMMTLEQVLHSDVTSVSRRREDAFKSPAAIFTITSEDIRRTGVRSYPDALRLAPGMNVAQLDANTWAVSSRGFNDVFADKLLVQSDGRTLYYPSANGVFWNIQHYLLEDIDRIEVIRGPGGSLWGANAVNGIVNIVTKDAKETLGTYATAGGGTAEQAFAGARYGTQLTENGYGRAYINFHDRTHFPDGNDDSDFTQGGFRTDWHLDENHYTLQGDAYYDTHGLDVAARPSYTAPYFPLSTKVFRGEGANALGRFTHAFSDESDLELQAYYDRAVRYELGARQVQDIYDVDFQHRFQLPLRQNLMYGLGYRYYPDHAEDSAVLNYTRSDRHAQKFSTFLQDEIALWPDRLKLTLGTKLEHNDYTDWEVQPNARLAWTPTEHQTVWMAVSRAVQVPSRANREITAPILAISPPTVAGLPLFIRGLPNPDIKAQELIAYEIGYRIQPVENLSFDVTAFYNDYDNLITGQNGKPFFEAQPTPHLVLPVTAINGGQGKTYGTEIASQWRVMDGWRLAASYSLLLFELDSSTSSQFAAGKDPSHQATLRSSFDLPYHLEFDLLGRFVDRLETLKVEGYFDLDARLAWQATRNVELAIVGQNLISSERVEFASGAILRQRVNPVPRGVYGQITIRF